MTPVDIDGERFCRLVEQRGTQLQHALVAALGPDMGADATSEALAWGWEHRTRIGTMDNPIGYLFTVGRNWGRRQMRRRATTRCALPDPATDAEPSVEPALPAALLKLSERQRTATLLVHGAGWTTAEVAEVLGIDRGTVHKHADRGLRSLRTALGVSSNE